jgi:Zn-dependent peptidase ImmA (M78 family)
MFINDIKEATISAYRINYMRARGIQRTVPQLIAFEFGGHNISINNDPEFLKSLGLCFTAISKEADNTYIISVDNNYLNAPEYCRQFLLAHELGHLINEDLEGATKKTMIRRVFKSWFSVDETEICADNYAVQVFGKEQAILSLNYLIAALKNKNEVKRRKKIIEAL